MAASWPGDVRPQLVYKFRRLWQLEAEVCKTPVKARRWHGILGRSKGFGVSTRSELGASAFARRAMGPERARTSGRQDGSLNSLSPECGIGKAACGCDTGGRTASEHRYQRTYGATPRNRSSRKTNMRPRSDTTIDSASGSASCDNVATSSGRFPLGGSAVRCWGSGYRRRAGRPRAASCGAAGTRRQPRPQPCLADHGWLWCYRHN
jgi:hypothetical protein